MLWLQKMNTSLIIYIVHKAIGRVVTNLALGLHLPEKNEGRSQMLLHRVATLARD